MSTYVNDPVSSPLLQQPVAPAPLQPRTRSYPNLINNYVNLDPRGGGVGPTGVAAPRPEAAAEAECRQLRLLLLAAQGRHHRLDRLEHEVAALRDTYTALTASADRQARLEVALRRAAERESAALRSELLHAQQQLAVATVATRCPSASTEVMRALVEHKDAHIELLQQENRHLYMQQLHQAHHQTAPSSLSTAVALSRCTSVGVLPQTASSGLVSGAPMSMVPNQIVDKVLLSPTGSTGEDHSLSQLCQPLAPADSTSTVPQASNC